MLHPEERHQAGVLQVGYTALVGGLVFGLGVAVDRGLGGEAEREDDESAEPLGLDRLPEVERVEPLKVGLEKVPAIRVRQELPEADYFPASAPDASRIESMSFTSSSATLSRGMFFFSMTART